MADIFVSYASADRHLVEPLVRELEASGYSVWWDRNIDLGTQFDREIEEALAIASCIVVVWSINSVNSDWVREEAQEGLSRKNLVPVSLDGCQAPLGFRRVQTAALNGWPNDRLSLTSVLARIDKLVKPSDASANDPVPFSSRSRRLSVIAGLAFILLGGVVWWVSNERPSSNEWVYTQALPAITEYVNGDRVDLAFQVAQEIEQRQPDYPELADLWSQVAISGQLVVEPPDATLSVRSVIGDEWIEVPIDAAGRVRVPRALLEWRVEAAGKQTLRSIWQPPLSSNKFEHEIRLIGESADSFLPIPSFSVHPVLSGRILNSPTQVGSFEVYRTEVSNAEYAQFVEAGGYTNAAYWQDLMFADATGDMEMSDAFSRFVDTTGRPGPATWILGTFSPGSDNLPVNGISWFEAMAYAKYKGASLPTVSHWVAAAQPLYAHAVVPRSNFGQSLASVDSHSGYGPFGTLNMAGNVREWTLNAREPHERWILGASHKDPDYIFSQPELVSAWDRSEINGIRLVRYASTPAASLTARFDFTFREKENLEPVSDTTFKVLSEQFVDRGGPLDANLEWEEDRGNYVHRRVTTASDVPGERLIINLLIPKGATELLQPIIYFDGAPSVNLSTSKQVTRSFFAERAMQLALRTKRVLVWPVFWGTFERYKPERDFLTIEARKSGLSSTGVVHWWSDLQRTLDYLAEQPEFKDQPVGYVGFSLGASVVIPSLTMVALQNHRLSTAVLISGGLPHDSLTKIPALSDPVNYLHRLELPVLMINGSQDTVFPVETNQRYMWTHLQRQDVAREWFVVENESHALIVRNDVLAKAADWLDTHMGSTRP